MNATPATIAKYILLFCLTLVSILAADMPRTKIFALSSNYEAAVVGSGCSLPDGSTPAVIQDDGHTCCPGANTHVDASTCLFAKYINPLIALLSAATGLLVVISIVYGAFETVTAGADVAKAAAGRKRIIQALIGLFAYISLYALLQFLIPGGLPTL